MTQTGKLKLATRDIAVLSLCAAIMFALKVALMWLPNIHLGAFLIIIFTLTFRFKVFYIIYLYVLLEILVFGFNPMWAIGYLYVWSILSGLVLIFKDMEKPLGWAILAGTFGLSFGALMAPPFLLISVGTTGFSGAFLPYWIAGIPFDIAHCIGNFAICFFLFKPVMRLMQRLKFT